MKASVDYRESMDGQYYFVVKARNGEIVSQSELYRQKQSAVDGFASLTNTCIEIRCNDRCIPALIVKWLKKILGFK